MGRWYNNIIIYGHFAIILCMLYTGLCKCSVITVVKYKKSLVFIIKIMLSFEVMESQYISNGIFFHYANRTAINFWKSTLFTTLYLPHA